MLGRRHCGSGGQKERKLQERARLLFYILRYCCCYDVVVVVDVDYLGPELFDLRDGLHRPPSLQSKYSYPAVSGSRRHHCAEVNAAAEHLQRKGDVRKERVQIAQS